jgi:hypothetical protein
VTNFVFTGSFCAASLHSLAGESFINTLDLIKDASRFYDRDPMIGCAFAAYPYAFQPAFLVIGLSGNIRIQIFPPRFDVTRHRDTCRFNLAIRDPAGLEGA